MLEQAPALAHGATSAVLTLLRPPPSVLPVAMLHFVFMINLFIYFWAGSHYAAMTGPKLKAAFELRSAGPSLPSAATKDMCHHAWIPPPFLIYLLVGARACACNGSSRG